MDSLESITTNITDTIQPKIIYDDTLERNKVTPVVNEQDVSEILDLFPGIDRSKLNIRIVSFFTSEYGISLDPESEEITVTVGGNDSKKSTLALANALTELSYDGKQPGKINNAVTHMGEAARDYLDEAPALIGILPGLITVEAAGEYARQSTPFARRQQKMAKKVLKQGSRIF